MRFCVPQDLIEHKPHLRRWNTRSPRVTPEFEIQSCLLARFQILQSVRKSFATDLNACVSDGVQAGCNDVELPLRPRALR